MKKEVSISKKAQERKVQEIMRARKMNKSQKIRALFNAGKAIKEISELLEIRYNFAYNVISRTLKKEQAVA